MTAVAPNMYETTIPVLEAGSWVIYKIIAYDNGGNQAINDNHGYFYVYRIIPEFQSALILLLFMIATLLAVTACRIKKFNVTTRKRRVC
jgi:hypothetical protein